MKDYSNHYVKLSARSATFKDEYLKTLGVLSGLTLYKDMQPRDHFRYAQIIRGSGLWNAHKVDMLYFKDGKFYYFFNKNSIEANEKMIEKYADANEKPDYIIEMIEYNRREKELAERAAEFVTVIPCYKLA